MPEKHELPRKTRKLVERIGAEIEAFLDKQGRAKLENLQAEYARLKKAEKRWATERDRLENTARLLRKQNALCTAEVQRLKAELGVSTT